MQCLAARSLCINLFSDKYSMPLAICRHMESSCFLVSRTIVLVATACGTLLKSDSCVRRPR